MAALRDMHAEDLDEIEILEKSLFGASAWHKENLLQDLAENPYSHYYLVEEDEEILGYCGVMILYENAEILTIGVKAKARRCGYARMMMERMLEESRQRGAEMMSLEVRVSNYPAIALYQSYGFCQAAVRPYYYQDGENALLMIKRLGEQS